MEAYDKLLESWLTLVQDEEHFPRGCFVQPAVQVFNSYIQCHLAAPDGTRNLVRLSPFCAFRPTCHFSTHCVLLRVSKSVCIADFKVREKWRTLLVPNRGYVFLILLFKCACRTLKCVFRFPLHYNLFPLPPHMLTLLAHPPTPQSVNGISSHEEEEINELQEDDRELFSDQLSSIGMLGRVAADHCIPLLTRLRTHIICIIMMSLEALCDLGSWRSETVLVFPMLTSILWPHPAACWRTGWHGCTVNSRGPSSTSWPHLTLDR